MFLRIFENGSMTNKYIQQLVSLLSHRITMIIILVSLYIVFSQHIPLNIERCMYAISLSIKDVLLLLMPISIFAFISTSIISFQKKATLFVVSIVLFEALSNFTSTWYAYITAMMVNNNVIAVVNQAQHDFTPLFRLGINKSTWWNPSNGSIAGVICGLLIAILETKLNGKKSYLTHCIISGLRYIKGLVFFLKSKA